MAIYLHLWTFISLIGLTRSELVYICDSDSYQQKMVSQSDYQSCGTDCTCTAFEALCVYDQTEVVPSQGYSVEKVSLIEAQTCYSDILDCFCNTKEETEWKTKTKQAFGLEAPWRKLVVVPPYAADLDEKALSTTYP